MINSVHWPTVGRALLHLYPDYYWGKGHSNALVNITLELTYRCQWGCEFCFLKDNVLNREVDEISFEAIERLVEAAAPHKLGFFLTGGEPFIRTDCIDIIRLIKSHGLKVGINTNHALLNEEKIETLSEIGLDYLISSVHGPREIHNAITHAKNYDKVIANLKYWKSSGSKTRTLVNYVMTPENCVHMKEMVAIAADAGVDVLTFQHESFLTRKEKDAHNATWQEVLHAPNTVEFSHLEFDPAYHDAEKLKMHMRETRAEARKRGVVVFFKPDLTDEQMDTWYSDDFRYEGRCSYLYTDLRINPQGDVITCQPLPFPVGNIRDNDPLELFNSEAFRAFRRGIKTSGGLFPACARCCKLHRRF